MINPLLPQFKLITQSRMVRKLSKGIGHQTVLLLFNGYDLNKDSILDSAVISANMMQGLHNKTIRQAVIEGIMQIAEAQCAAIDHSFAPHDFQKVCVQAASHHFLAWETMMQTNPQISPYALDVMQEAVRLAFVELKIITRPKKLDMPKHSYFPMGWKPHSPSFSIAYNGALDQLRQNDAAAEEAVISSKEMPQIAANIAGVIEENEKLVVLCPPSVEQLAACAVDALPQARKAASRRECPFIYRGVTVRAVNIAGVKLGFLHAQRESSR